MSPDGLAALCAAALPDEGLSADDLARSCFGPDTEVLGDDRGAAVLTVKRSGPDTVAWIVLLAVAPDRRGRGLGRRLVETVAGRALDHGARELHLGNAAPRYVWPGVDFAFTEALALFEASGFEPYGAECNMTISTAFRAEAPAGATLVREAGSAARELARTAFPHWEDEVARATDSATCFAAHDATGATIAFASHSVNRRGWIGPMATVPDRRHAGVGHALLGAVCADLARGGVPDADIAWVGPVGFYARAGARVNRVFRTARRKL